MNYPETVSYPGPAREDPAWASKPTEAFLPPARSAGTSAGTASGSSGTNVGTVVAAAGQVLGIYLLACVVVTSLLALAVTEGHAGNPVNWVRGAVILAALGLRGTGFMSAAVEGRSGIGAGTSGFGTDGTGGFGTDGTSGFGTDGFGTDGFGTSGFGAAEGSLSLAITPMLLLIGVLVLAYRAGRTGEHRSLSGDHRQALLSGAASGLVMTLALALLALATRFESTFGAGSLALGLGTSATVGAKVLPLFLYGFPMLTVAFAAGRSVTHRQVYGMPTLAEELRSRTAGVSDWVPAAALHAGVTAAIFAVITFGYGVTHPGGGLSSFSMLSVSGLLLYLLVSANAGLLGAAVFMGMSGHPSGSSTLFGGGTAGGLSGGDATVGLFHGDVGGIDLLWLLLPPLVALAVGIRQAYRSPASPWWQGGLASLGLWLALAFLLRASFSAGGEGMSVDMTFGLDLLTLGVVSFGYGALAQHGGRALAGPLRTNAPNAAHVLGYRTPAVTAPVQHQLWR